ncbi:substrate-binding domain-containing protein [Salmonella enterica subsp. enterica]|nr:substrate-binding domain-containing protein [Salmonella enterica subsp. enterica]
MPDSAVKHWAAEREYAFRQLVAEEKYRGRSSSGGWKTAPEKLAASRKIASPTGFRDAAAATGIIAVTDARARHVLQACEHLHIPGAGKLALSVLDNEEQPCYLSRVALPRSRRGAANGLSSGEAAAPFAGAKRCRCWRAFWRRRCASLRAPSTDHRP